MNLDAPRAQEALTVITPIRSGQVDTLRRMLDELGDDIGGAGRFPFHELRRVHFLRWVILDGVNDAAPSLVLGTDYDPPRHEHLEELVRVGSAHLHAIYEHCEGFPPATERSDANVAAYLKAHDVGPGSLYRGTPWRSVQRIRREAALRDNIRALLDAGGAELRGRAPQEIVAHIREHLRADQDHAWAVTAPAPADPRTRVQLVLLYAAVAVVVLVALPVLVVALGALRFKERNDERRDDPGGQHAIRQARDRVGMLAEREDHLVINQMTHVSHVKPGWLRLAVLHTVLTVVGLLARWQFVEGKLGDIATIHFARWVVIDGGRRLLFFSNFDGSWERYLGDFIDRAARGLTGVWSNTRGFPPTRWLLAAGARAEDRFKTWARAYQLRTQVWYAAVPGLSVPNIINNSKIRAGIADPPVDDGAAARWLKLL